MYPPPQQQGGSSGGNASEAALMAALAMAAAQEEAQSKKKYVEAVLPVALLVILALIFAYKMGFIDLSFLPFLNRPVEVLILTDNPSSPQIQSVLQVLQRDASYYKIKVRTMTIGPNTRLNAKQLADADVVMLYQTSDTPVLTIIQRRELATYLKAGGKLIVVKDSGTYMPECDMGGVSCDPTKAIWVGWLRLEDFMPVDCGDEMSCKPESVASPTLYTIDPDHPIMQGFDKIELKQITAIKSLQLSKNGVDIADIYENGVDNPTAVMLGVTVSQGLLGTKVIHFNYEPYASRQVLINAILYLAGRAS